MDTNAGLSEEYIRYIIGGARRGDQKKNSERSLAFSVDNGPPYVLRKELPAFTNFSEERRGAPLCPTMVYRMSELYLIRHAQASFKSAHYDRLSELGVRQSQVLGEYFSRIGIAFDAVHSGRMERQKATALACLGRLHLDRATAEPLIAPEFDEYNAQLIIGTLAPALTREDPSMAEAFANLFTDGQALKKVFETAMLRWVTGRAEIPGMETWLDFKARVRSGIDRVCAEPGRKKRIAVFTSGGAICAAMQIALTLSDEETISLALQVRNASVSVFRHDGETLRLQSFNSIAHLELMREPHLITYR